MKKKDLEFEISSGNVFADLGLSNPEERLTKAELARQIYNLIREKKFTQSKATKVLSITQSQLSFLYKGRLDDFSIDQLLRFLIVLGRSIYINVRIPSGKSKKASIRVSAPRLKKIDPVGQTDEPVSVKKR